MKGASSLSEPEECSHHELASVPKLVGDINIHQLWKSLLRKCKIVDAEAEVQKLSQHYEVASGAVIEVVLIASSTHAGMPLAMSCILVEVAPSHNDLEVR